MNNIANAVVAGVIALLVLAGVIVGVTAFKTSQYKANCGQNATGGTAAISYGSCSSAANLTRNIEDMSNKFSSQLGTVGTMLGVALILGAIGLIGYGVYSGAKKVQ